MSIEAITALWKAKQAQAQAKRHEADMLEAEARGLRQALDALQQELVDGPSDRQLPQQFSPPTEKSRKASPGRQPGAISTKWKRHLLALDDREELFNEEDVAQLVLETENRIMKPSEIKRLFDNFIRYGHVKIDNDNFYYVPDSVAKRFQTALRNENEDVNSDNQSSEVDSVTSDDASDSSEDETSDFEGDIVLSVLNQDRHHRAN